MKRLLTVPLALLIRPGSLMRFSPVTHPRLDFFPPYSG